MYTKTYRIMCIIISYSICYSIRNEQFEYNRTPTRKYEFAI